MCYRAECLNLFNLLYMVTRWKRFISTVNVTRASDKSLCGMHVISRNVQIVPLTSGYFFPATSLFSHR